MTGLRRIDARFLLPHVPRQARVLPGADAWLDHLPRLGLDLDARAPDFVVCGSQAARAAAATGAPSLIVEGASARAPDGYTERRFFALPSVDDASLFVPVDRRNVAGYALDTWLFPSTWPKVMRKRAAVALAGAPLSLLRRPTLLVATRDRAEPALVAAAARRFALGEDLGWFMVGGQGDELARGVFFLFRERAREPSWAVKFARVPAYREPFDRDEAALDLVAEAGGAAAARAPRLIGRFAVDGYDASLETAAVGIRLTAALRAPGSRRPKLELVERVAAWIVRVAAETRGAPGSAAREAERLRRDVVPSWPGVEPTLADGVDALCGVLQHNDLGSWNVLVDGRGEFTAIDWESARRPGLPLWDLWYFLAHALTQLDAPEEDRVSAFRRLFRGDAPSSPVLFRWTRAAAGAAGVEPDLVGRLATLCWLHHGLSHVAREAALGAPAPRWAAARFPHVWLEDPVLGTAWSAWRRT